MNIRAVKNILSRGILSAVFILVNTALFAQLTAVDQNKKDACDGLPNGSIEILVTNSSGPISIQIFGPPNFVAAPSEGVAEEFTGLPPRSYLAIVQDDDESVLVSFTINDVVTPITASVDPGSPSDNTSCSILDGFINITASGGSGSLSFSWTADNGFTSTSEDISGLAGGLYDVTITDDNTYCSFTILDIPITDPSPDATLAVSDGQVCNPAASDINITITSAESGVSYEIKELGGTSLAPQVIDTGTGGDLVLTIPQAQAPTVNTTYQIEAINGFCTPVILNDNPTVIVSDAPLADAGSDEETCSNTAIDLSASVTAPTASNFSTLSWSTSGDGTFDDNSLLAPTYTPGVGDATAGTITLTLQANGNGSCLPVTSDMTLTVTPAPIADAGSDEEICTGDNLDLSASLTAPTASNFSTLSWSTSGDGTFDDNSLLAPTYTPGVGDITAGTVTLTIQANGNVSCLPTTSDMLLTITPAPLADAGSDEETCSNTAIDLSASVTAPTASNFSTLSWSTSGDGTFDDNSLLAPTYTPGVGDATAGTITLTLQANGNGSCLPVTSDMTLTVTPAPIADAGSDEEICTGDDLDLSASLTAPTASNFSTLSWSTSGDGTFDDNSLLAPTYTPGVGDITAGTVTLTIQANGNVSCLPTTSDMLLTITPAPLADAGSDEETCSNTAIDLSASVTAPTASNFSTLSWSTSGDGTFDDNSLLAPTYTPGVGDATAGTITLTLQANGNGSCLPVTSDMTLTVTPAPIADAGSDEEICTGDDLDLSASLTAPTASNFSTLSWSTSGDGTFDDNSLLAPTYTPGVGDITAGTVTLTIQANGNVSCLPTTSDMLLTITPAPLADAGSDEETCSNTAIDLSASVTAPTASNFSTLSWSTSGDGTFDDNSLLAPTYTPGVGDATAGTITLTLQANGNGSCLPVTSDMTLTVTPAPIADAGSDEEICTGDNLDLSASLTAPTASNFSTLSWSTSGDGTFDDNSLLAPTYTPGVGDITAGTVTLTIQANGNVSCLPTTSDMLLTITPAPLADAGSDEETCSNTAIDLSASVTAPTASNFSTLSWSTSGDGTFDDNSLLAPTYTPGVGDATAGTITLTLQANGNGSCLPVTSDMTLTVTPAPIADAGSDEEICTGDDLDLSASLTAPTASNFSTLSWSTSGDGTFDDNSLLAPTYTPGVGDITAGTVTLTIQANGNVSCLPTTSDMLLTITPAPLADAGSDEETCSNTAIDLSASVTAPTASNFSTLSWSTSGDGTFDDNSLLAPTYTPGVGDATAGTITLTLQANGCTFITSDMILTITPPPIADAGSDEEICTGDDLDLSASLTAPTASNFSTLSWSTSGDGTFDDNSLLAPIYTPGVGDITAGTVTLTIQANGNVSCLPTTSDMLLTITPAPLADAGSDEETCSNTAIDLSASVTAPTASNFSTLSWSTSGDGTFDDNSLLAPTYTPGVGDATAGTITLTLQANGNGSCLPVTSDMTLTVTPAPIADAGSDEEICTGDNLDLSASLTAPTASNFSTLSWSTSGDGTFDDNSLLAPTYTPGVGDITAGTVTLTIQANGNVSCLPTTSDMLLTITPAPLADAGSDEETCSNTAIDLSASVTAPTASNFSTLSWSTSGDGTFDDNSLLAPTYTPGVGDATAGTITLTLQANGNGSCLPVTSDMTLTVTPAPIADAGSDEEICTGDDLDLSASLTAPTASNFSTLSWSTSGDGTFDDNSLLAPIYTPGVGDITAGTVTLTIQANGNVSCLPTTSDMLLTITPAPLADAGSDEETCSNTAIDLSASVTAPTASNFSTLSWSTSGDGTFDDNSLLAPTYTPGVGDATAGTITLTLQANGNGSCLPVTSDMILTVNPEVTIIANPTNPSVCSGTDGSIEISGLEASTNYDLQYFEDGVQIDVLGITSDVSGVFFITSLDAGNYTNFIALNTITNCPSNTLAGPVVLSDPGAATIALGTTSDPSTCSGTSGLIQITGLVASTNYDLTYFDDGVQVDVAGITSDALGNFIISSLDAGDYTTISFTEVGSGCKSNTLAGITLNDPSGESINIALTNFPTACGASDGEIVLSGVIANTNYSVDYELNGNPVSIASITSDGIGQLTIGNLAAGSYNNIFVTGPSNCPSDIITVPEVLSDPGAVSITVSQLDPTSCGGTGSITISGLAASTSYDVFYNDDATPITLNGQLSNVSGEILITGLNAGSYTDIRVVESGCTSNTLPGPFALVDPTPVTIAFNNVIDPTICGAADGQINIMGLDNSTLYQVDLTFNGTPLSAGNFTSDGAGNLSINTLAAGSYDNITVTDPSSCQSAPLTGPFDLVDPGAPIIAFSTSTDPTTCDGTEGIIELSGLLASTLYNIDFEFNSTPTTVQFTSEASGLLQITGLEDGDYLNINVEEDGTGCISNFLVGPFTLTDPTVPTFALGTDTDPSTCGGNEGSIQLTGLVASTIYNVSFDFNTVTTIVSGVSSDVSGVLVIPNLLAGDYTNFVVQEVSTICSSLVDATTVSLSDPSVPVVTVDATSDVTTCGGSDGSIDINVTGGSGDYIFTWSDGGAFSSGSEDLTGLEIGSYTLNLTDNITGCSIVAPVIVNIGGPVSPTLSFAATDVTTCGGSDGAIDLTIADGSGDYSVAWSGPNSFTSSNEDVSSLEEGTYDAEVTDNISGCVVNGSTTVGSPATFTIAAVGTDATGCGTSDGSVDLTVTGTGTFTFAWTGPNGFTATSEDISALEGGDYDVVVTDGVSGCTASTSLTISEPINFTLASVKTDATACGAADGSVDLTITGAGADITIEWTGPNSFTDSNEDISGLGAGDYTVVVTDNVSGCSDNITVSIVEPVNFTLSVASTDVSVCGADDGAIDLTVVGGSGDYTFAWTGPNGFTEVTEDIGSLQLQGNYQVTVTDNVSGCTDAIVGTVNLPAGCAVDCAAFTAIIPNVTRPSCGTINDGALSFDIQGGSGNYLVTMTDSQGNPYSTQSAVPTFNNLSPETYTYIVTDVVTGNICDDGRTIALELLSTVEGELLANSIENITCFGETGAVTLTGITPLLSQYFYSVDGGSTWTQLPGNNRVEGLQAGITSIRLGAAVNDPCPDIIDVTVSTTNPAIVVTASSKALSTCDSNDGEVSVDFPPTGGANSTGDDWAIAFKRTSSLVTDGDFGLFSEDVIFTNLEANSYTLYVRDISDCTYSEEFIIGSPGQIEIDEFNSFAQSASCDAPSSGSVVMRLANLGAVSPPFNVSIATVDDPENPVYVDDQGWNGDTRIFPRTGDGLLSGDYIATVLSNTEGICAGTFEFTIDGGPVPVSFDYELQQSCFGTTREYVNELLLTDITGEAGIDYVLTVFNDQQQVVDMLTLTLQIGSQIRVTNRSFLQTPDRTFRLRLGQSQNACPDNIFFDHPSSLEVPEIVAPLSVEVGNITSSLPERSTGTFDIISISGGVAPFNAVLEGDVPGFGGLGPDEVPFDAFSGKFTLGYNDLGVGDYDLFVIDALGCEIELDIDIPRDSSLFIPNVITPNGDGINDYFVIRNLDISSADKSANLIITSRWGKQIYSSDNYTNENPWGGDEAAEGLFFYKLEAGGEVYTGWIEVIFGGSP